MSLGALLVHSLIIERATSGAQDDRGVPAQTWSTLASVRGRVRPMSMEEIGQLSQAGPVASDHRILLFPTDVQESDRIRFDPDDGRRYQLDAVHTPSAGDHLEIDAHLVEGV